MSGAGHAQFRYTQTPSKVIHLRNLPWECHEDELIQLCSPFGKVVNTKCNVGANKNQAFVEFAEQSQAIAMVSYYASSPDPAHIRGKTVYIQYSNRQEIVHNKSPGDVPGNVLLVTIEGVEAGDVSIEVIHLVFSAFGFVHKIATFEKAAGFQALIQFSDAETACTAKNQLDGRSIPRYLLPPHVTSCNLRISYSAHTDLNIKFQSHRSRGYSQVWQPEDRCLILASQYSFSLLYGFRDYTNPYLPVNSTAFEGSLQPGLGTDGKKLEPESNVLLAAIENMQYAVTVDTLHMVFSSFGPVQKIAIFEKNGGTQALIQYPDVTTATVAKEALEGHCIYDGGYCKLHITYSRHTDLNIKAYSDRSRDYTIPNPNIASSQLSGVPSASTTWQTHLVTSEYPNSGYAAAGPVDPSQEPSSWPPGASPAAGSIHTGFQPDLRPGVSSPPYYGKSFLTCNKSLEFSWDEVRNDSTENFQGWIYWQ